ncbi:nicotine blue oxidoreductase [Herbihabitans rhizosphaerae]|uniref:Nicotine blue oxidoreductase n=1 Tax=Herbihabitans rhizosphaerae TaxID=1872711 RepID=A0A4Q7KBK4_9PSEU|nr:nucleotidyltransferase family protein [Herbihabitans rhizosphaerae]RZS30327.1 nicotine blue oxidoreductase [Herbihabitans rhizosphaerae]
MTAAILLAAGAGRRFGMPKALAEIDGEPLVRNALRVLSDAGCAPVRVVVGAAADQVLALLPDGVAVVAEDWERGMSASLRAGLLAMLALEPVPDAALIHLVDLPGVGVEAVRRVAALAGPDVLARAAYAGEPGHPVLIGRRYWDDVLSDLAGDQGARGWLAGRDVRLVECGDVASGRDLDYRS